MIFFCFLSALATLGLAIGAMLLFPGLLRFELAGGAAGLQTNSALPSRSGSASQSPTPVLSAAVGGALTNSGTDDEQNNIAIYQACNEAMVNISAEVLVQSFFDVYSQEGDIGSGSIIDKRGYILTNNHVVKNANKVHVTLADGTQLDGTVIGVDVENDLAVVKVDPKGKELKTINLGQSAELRVGQKVLAIGNPFAYDRTLTTGIVSGLGRPVKSNDSNVVIRNMIQTDASINPGNSGGPLLDSRGNMIGINTMIVNANGGAGSVGVGFAVPVDTAKRVVPELIQNGKVRRGWIDIAPVQLFAELVDYDRLPVHAGLLLSKVDPGSNAAQAGLQGGSKNKAVRYGRTIIYLGGDIMVEVGGVAIESIADLYTALEDKKPGDKVKVVYWRGNQRLETQVVLNERPANYNLE